MDVAIQSARSAEKWIGCGRRGATGRSIVLPATVADTIRVPVSYIKPLPARDYGIASDPRSEIQRAHIFGPGRPFSEVAVTRSLVEFPPGNVCGSALAVHPYEIRKHRLRRCLAVVDASLGRDRARHVAPGCTPRAFIGQDLPCTTRACREHKGEPP
jgi:hypothetical protein